jgi:protein-S-isoprenylcysteine O-methyltransferase Ste14
MSKLWAWTGGALFVAALAVTGWTFVRVWSADRAFAGAAAIGVDVGLLVLFAVHHSVFARTWAKRAVALAVPDRLMRSVYVWIASVLLIAVCLLWQPVGGTLYDDAGALRVAHVLVQLAGVWLIARAVGAIDALDLAGIRQVMTSRPSPAAAGLQVRGPYRLVRHPLYLGWVLIVFGPAHLTGDRLLFAVVTTAYLAIAVPWEERSLEAEFGDEYVRYRQHVRWRIVPYVY